MSTRRRFAALLPLIGVLLAGGCAARSKVPPGPAIGDAERLAAAGCYTCLVDALEVYETILARRPSAAAARGAFRAATLLALREKEIGLPATPYLERARRLAAPLAPAEDAQLALDVADAMPWDYAGLAKDLTEELIRKRQAVTPLVPGWRERLRAKRADPFFAYLEASLACSYGDWRARDVSLDELAKTGASPLLKYRLGACVPGRRGELEEVLAADPRFVEAHLFLGRYALIDASMGRGARRAVADHLDAAYAAFPRSPSVTVALGSMHRAFSRLKDALRFYDETLVLVPAHREAMLGRIIALTYLDRPDEAIAGATRLIELGEWYVGDAYYWRAFNRHSQKSLDAARDDIEQAKAVAGIRADVFLLAGMIYYDRRELEAAAADLAKSWETDETTCDAAWYLGLVRSEQQGWTDAAALFPKAAACYRAAADGYRAQLQTLANTLDAADDLAGTEAEYLQLIERQLVSEARSYYNAAYACARHGDRARALEFAGLAARHAVMKEKAEQLIQALKTGGG